MSIKLKSINQSNSIILELKEEEKEHFIKKITQLVESINDELIINCEITINIFKNINRNKIKFIAEDNLIDDYIFEENGIITLLLERDIYDHMIGLIEDISSEKIPTTMYEVVEISSKKCKQSSYLVLSCPRVVCQEGVTTNGN